MARARLAGACAGRPRAALAGRAVLRGRGRRRRPRRCERAPPPRGDTSPEPAAAHLRRRERRGLLEPGREAADLPAQRATGVPCDQEFVIDVATGARTRVSTGRAGLPAATSSTAGSASSTPRPTSPRPTARRGPITRRATSGRSTRPTTSSPPARTAPTRAASPRPPATTPRPPSRPTAGPSSSPRCATATSRSTRWTRTGGRVKRLTHEPGYDGGPFFSPDGKRIVWRRDAPGGRGGARAATGSCSARGSTRPGTSRSG